MRALIMDDIRPAIPSKSTHFLAALNSSRRDHNDAYPPIVHSYVPGGSTQWAINAVNG